MNDKVDVVIPHYGNDKDLEECIKSFEKNEYVNTIFTIDNNKNNVGFSKGVNLGLSKSLNTDTDFVAIVNNDTVCVDKPFKPMVDVMVTYPNTAIVGPKIIHSENQDQIIHAGGLQCFPNGVHKSGLVSLGNHDKISKEKWLSFVVVMMRKEHLIKIGHLDEHMFLIFSDSDWCYRARYAGFDVHYCPDSVWTHKVGESGMPTSEWSMTQQKQDGFHFWKKWIAQGRAFQELDMEILNE